MIRPKRPNLKLISNDEKKTIVLKPIAPVVPVRPVPPESFNPAKLQIPLSPERIEQLNLLVRPADSAQVVMPVNTPEQIVLPRHPAQVAADNLRANNLESFALPNPAEEMPQTVVPVRPVANVFRAPNETLDNPQLIFQ